MENAYIELPPPLSRVVDLDKAREIKLSFKYDEPVLYIYWGKNDYLKINGPLAVDTFDKIREKYAPTMIVETITRDQIMKRFGDEWQNIEEEEE
jgi:hypothetical protein